MHRVGSSELAHRNNSR